MSKKSSICAPRMIIANGLKYLKIAHVPCDGLYETLEIPSDFIRPKGPMNSGALL